MDKPSKEESDGGPNKTPDDITHGKQSQIEELDDELEELLDGKVSSIAMPSVHWAPYILHPHIHWLIAAFCNLFISICNVIIIIGGIGNIINIIIIML